MIRELGYSYFIFILPISPYESRYQNKAINLW
jgi:hypothetical protein